MPRLDHARSQIHLAANELADLDRQLAQMIALLDRDVVLHETVRLLTDEFGLHCAWIAERVGTEGVLIRHTSGNRTEKFHGVTLRTGHGLGGKVFALGGVEWVDDYIGSAAITHHYDGQVAAESIKRMIAAPISGDGGPVGVLLGGLRDGGTFGNRAAVVVETAAERTSQALRVAERARKAADAAVHEERQRMALDLHDSVGAMLFAITAGVRSATEQSSVDAGMRERLLAIEKQASEAAVTLRESLRALRTPPEQLALGAALRVLCRSFEERSKLGAELVMLDLLLPLDEGGVKALIAAAREALLNVEKHAQATRVMVTVATMHDGVALTVTDDGVGLGTAQPDHRGFGLEAIRDVLNEIGGRLQLTEDGDEGLSFRAWVPYRS
jgi:LuxR family transcriptional regulator, regulator of acetate metabolism